jgi:hypothetical protein
MIGGIVAAACLIAPAGAAVAQSADTVSSTTVTTTTMSAPPAAMAPATVDYSVLASQKLDYLTIQRAHAYGLTTDEISDAYALAHETLRSFPEVLDRIENGATFASLAEAWGVPLQDVYTPERNRDRIRDYVAAYECTGTAALHNRSWQSWPTWSNWQSGTSTVTDSTVINGTGAAGVVSTPMSSTTTTTITPASPAPGMTTSTTSTTNETTTTPAQ